ncbi:MAG: HAD-IIB family hydrolase, partial [bacterium]
MNQKLLIFTDLDGTLLDHQTYAFKAALPALKKIKNRNIPLILTSSKTRVEIEVIQHELENTDPLIVENGGAVYIPENYFYTEFEFQKRQEGYLVIELGVPYSKLREALNKIKSETGLPIVGFGDLRVQEVAKVTGLSLDKAHLALKREYDEPFFLNDEIEKSNLNQLRRLVSNFGLNLTMGGRFFHLLGNNDKGKAVKILTSIFKKEWGNQIKTVGLGDSLNDLPMLEAVD